MTLKSYLMTLISLLTGKKITNVREERFIKIEDALIDLQTQQFSSKNENALDNV